MSRDAIILDAALDAPPDIVWRALTEPQWVARWLASGEISAQVGASFTLWPGGAAGAEPIECEVVEAEPVRRLSYRWRGQPQFGSEAMDTVVTWVLDPTPDGGTRLRLIHEGFPLILAQPGQTCRGRGPIINLATRREASRGRAASDPGRLAWAA
jgi:uncharacterized protein YndB with AHSA1/START domain